MEKNDPRTEVAEALLRKLRLALLDQVVNHHFAEFLPALQITGVSPKEIYSAVFKQTVGMIQGFAVQAANVEAGRDKWDTKELGRLDPDFYLIYLDRLTDLYDTVFADTLNLLKAHNEVTDPRVDPTRN